MKKQEKFIEFIKSEKPHGRATDIFFVTTIKGAERLGFVSWHAPWRKYTFSPYPNMTFDEGCLIAIKDFINEQMFIRAAARRIAKGI